MRPPAALASATAARAAARPSRCWPRYGSGHGSTWTYGGRPDPPGPSNLYGDRSRAARVCPWYAPSITATCVAPGTAAEAVMAHNTALTCSKAQ